MTTLLAHRSPACSYLTVSAYAENSGMVAVENFIDVGNAPMKFHLCHLRAFLWVILETPENHWLEMYESRTHEKVHSQAALILDKPKPHTSKIIIDIFVGRVHSVQSSPAQFKTQVQNPAFLECPSPRENKCIIQVNGAQRTLYH